MLYLSALLPEKFPADAANLTAALEANGVPYRLLPGTRDIWLRDFMPVGTASGRFVSFRYEPDYLKDAENTRTDYRRDIAPHLSLPVSDSQINLDGGNVVYSPSRRRAIVSDRIYKENSACDPAAQEALVKELSELLEAEILVIPSLESDMTGHADGMVRFVDETRAIGNDVPAVNGLEQRIKAALGGYGIEVTDFPYQKSKGISAVGCYLNFLETQGHIFLPVFGIAQDEAALRAARQIFDKTVIPVSIPSIADEGGCLNCISWEGP